MTATPDVAGAGRPDPRLSALAGARRTAPLVLLVASLVQLVGFLGSPLGTVLAVTDAVSSPTPPSWAGLEPFASAGRVGLPWGRS